SIYWRIVMRVLIMNKKALYILLILLIVILIIPILLLNYNKTIDVFKTDIYYEGTRDEKIIAFTCNIDWGNEYIEDMLDIFKKYDIYITFFPTGRWVEKNEVLLKTIYEAEHEIGSHRYNHLDYSQLNFNSNYNEIKTSHDIIKEILGMEAKYFAPPSGAYNDYTLEAARDLGYKVILWSIDTIDWREDSTKDIIIERVVSKAHNSGIVLMHPTEETV